MGIYKVNPTYPWWKTHTSASVHDMDLKFSGIVENYILFTYKKVQAFVCTNI